MSLLKLILESNKDNWSTALHLLQQSFLGNRSSIMNCLKLKTNFLGYRQYVAWFLLV